MAAYWLFVVLMLATFTANLAAFLTVERMQTTVQSLEELAKQSRINYTVVGKEIWIVHLEPYNLVLFVMKEIPLFTSTSSIWPTLRKSSIRNGKS